MKLSRLMSLICPLIGLAVSFVQRVVVNLEQRKIFQLRSLYL